MSTGKVLLGVLAGAAAGALLGVLLAPDKGSATRKKIAKTSEDYADALKEKYDELMEGMVGKFTDAKDEVKSMVQNGKAKGEDFKKDVKSSMG
jgi:gas vesicle protein